MPAPLRPCPVPRSFDQQTSMEERRHTLEALLQVGCAGLGWGASRRARSGGRAVRLLLKPPLPHMHVFAHLLRF